MTIEQFLARWAESGAAERANKDAFLSELCDVLDVERPRPKTGNAAADTYVFEKDVPRARAGGASTSFVDLYKEGCFLLEAKQGALSGPKRRGTPAWNQLMSEAHGQALGYASNLDAPPPFLLVADLGYCFDLYASFDGTGLYRPFPDGHRKRIFLADIAKHADTLRAIWTDPASLDPAKRSAAVTRDIAEQIAALARALEAAGHAPEQVATFLMRCLFTMFSEDVGLLPPRLFSEMLETYWLPKPESFPEGVASLWQAMDVGGNFITGKLKRFNGGLFSSHDAPPLTKEQLILLLMAAQSDWSQVDPSIFGTLLERALNPKERHRLGAHYTPRAYVERLVRPTIEEPLRADWDLVRAEVRQLVEEGKIRAAEDAGNRASCSPPPSHPLGLLGGEAGTPLGDRRPGSEACLRPYTGHSFLRRPLVRRRRTTRGRRNSRVPVSRCSGSPIRRDLLQLLPQGSLGEPEVVSLLKPKPIGGPVAAEPAEPHRHFRGNARGFRQDAVKRLAGYPQLPCRFADRQAEGGEDIFAKDGSRVGRLASGALSFQHLRHGILLPLDSRVPRR